MEIRTISEFLTLVQGLQSQHPQEVFYFRGESMISWELRPSVMRENLAQFEKEMLSELITRRADEFKSGDLAVSQWVLAQHHGLQTRFLDITRNPLVALFHACNEFPHESAKLHIFAVPRELIKTFDSDTATIVANFAKLPYDEQNVLISTTQGHGNSDYTNALRHLYQLIGQEKPFFEERIDVRDLFRVFVVEPQQSSERIRAQSGAFLASAYHRRFEEGQVLLLNPRIPVYTHYTPTIPASSKEGITRDLRLLNITRETLFPGLDESAKAITESYRQRLSQS